MSLPMLCRPSLGLFTVAERSALQRRALSTQDCLSQKVTLPDGRVLAYAEYGTPTGYPVFYFHGFPASRLEPRGLPGHLPANDTLDTQSISLLDLRKRGFRWIAPDRPGFGLSDPHPGRRITQYPVDILHLSDALNLRDFAVIGGSGGGPYALACAHLLPRNRVTAAGLLASAVPWEAGPELQERYRRWLRWASLNIPFLLRPILNGVVGFLRWLSKTRYAQNKIDAWLETQTAKSDNLEKRTTPERREELLEILFEGFRQGSAGTVEEAVLLTDRPDWGWRFEDTKNGDRVIIWHGEFDANAPFKAMKWMADRIEGCELHQLDGATHYSSGDELGRMLGEFVVKIDEGKRRNKEDSGSVGAPGAQA